MPAPTARPGEFYQLDFEMSFVTQDDVFEAIEPVLAGVFEEFANGKSVTPAGEFPRIPYREAMLKYGSDKPDLRNPILISDVSEPFRRARASACSPASSRAAAWCAPSRRPAPRRRAANSSTT